MARPRPVYEDSDIEQDELEEILKADAQSSEEEDDDFGKLSFGALKNAQDQMDKEDGKSKKQGKKIVSSITDPRVIGLQRKKPQQAVKETRYDDSESEEEGAFFEEESEDELTKKPQRSQRSNDHKKSKHAPTEASSKKKVSRVREIPGLDNPKYKTLYKDIRFDTALGKSDLNKVRKDYKFLDDYRQNEIDQISSILKNNKLKNKMSQKEINDLEYQSKSLKSRLDSLKNRDLEKQVLEKYKKDYKDSNGVENSNKYYLKNSEKRKIIQKFKFENMKSSQREKVVERKRKRRLGKEFKQLEFNKPRN